jgi:CRISPR-associated protein Cas1
VHAPSLDVLRGFEGAAARRYFAALSRLLAPKWAFAGRNRQPPRDPVNVLLSYGYAVLFQNVLTLLVRRGLNPHLGALHAVGQAHAALASDLMEEFRPLVVDAVVLRLTLNDDLSADDFDHSGGKLPCCLRDRARRRFIKALEDKLDSPLHHPVSGRELDMRRAIAAQADAWALHVSGKARAYRPFVLH